MRNVAVVGSRDSVLIFKALGLEVVYCDAQEEAAREINRLAREGFAAIFVTEKLLCRLPEVAERYKRETLPAIIPIPDNRGSIGYGMNCLRDNVEKAVGSNILMDKGVD